MDVHEFETAIPKRRKISLVGDLNEDLLVEVLVRLPCKYVIRFKCVSKRWMSLISNPEFIKYFLDHHHQQISTSSSSSSSTTLSSKSKLKEPHKCWSFIGLDPCERWKGEKEVRFLAGCCLKVKQPLFNPGMPFLPKICSQEPEQVQNEIFVVGSFNDLILCSRGCSNPTVYYICNPLTMQFLTLPPAPLPPPPHADDPPVLERVCVGFVCEPSSLYPNYRCRVVRICPPIHQHHFPLPLELQIFSSETGLWSKKTILDVSSSPAGMRRRSFQGANLVSFENGQMVYFTGEYIIKFDALAAGSQSEVVVKGQFIELPGDFSRRNAGSDRSVVTSQGRLFLLRISVLCERWVATRPQIKVLEECNDNDGESNWKLIHHVQFNEMKRRPAFPSAETAFLDRYSIKDFMRVYPRIHSPHSQHVKKIWLELFLKGLQQNYYDDDDTHQVVCVGFDLNYPYVMYLILCPPGPALAALASYDMRTRTLQLVPRNRAPHHLRSLIGLGCNWIRRHRIVPFVLQPWPTPLPQVATVQSF